MATVKRLIDANALVYYCKEIAKHEWNKRSSPVSWSDAYEGFIDDIDEMPTVDAVEVVHGRWEYGKWEQGHWVKGNERCRCSVCHRDFAVDNSNIWHGCPQCLARMDGGNAELSNLREDDFCSYGERREGE